MAEKYLFISGIFTLVLLIDILFYWKTKKMSIPEHKYTTINTCLFIYVSAFLSLVGYLFFFGEKNGSLECRSETMTCEFHYSTPLLYPNKRLAQTFDISNVRRASVKKSTFLNQIAVYLPFATYLPLCNLLIINLFCNSGKYDK